MKRCRLLGTATMLLTTLLGGRVFGALYETDFSLDPDWTTNDPTHLGRDAGTDTFHGWQNNTGGTWAYKNIAGFDPNASWTLKFDSRLNSCDWSAGLTVGLLDSRLRYPYGALMDMGVVDGGHVVSIVGNGNGPPGTYTPSWTAGTWYTTTLAYNSMTHQLTMSTVVRSTGAPFMDLSMVVPSFASDMTRIGVSRLHMVGGGGMNPSAAVDYNLDNIWLTPEPATLALLALGGLAVIRRRQGRK